MFRNLVFSLFLLDFVNLSFARVSVGYIATKPKTRGLRGRDTLGIGGEYKGSQGEKGSEPRKQDRDINGSKTGMTAVEAGQRETEEVESDINNSGFSWNKNSNFGENSFSNSWSFSSSSNGSNEGSSNTQGGSNKQSSVKEESTKEHEVEERVDDIDKDVNDQDEGKNESSENKKKRREKRRQKRRKKRRKKRKKNNDHNNK
mmetsp:Transcript_49164/g.73065  ORF Transcript_49164/g.73065 Transcript_49164/m.73065 type:complete len:202 (+) Transcript_49164:130-735(+)